MLTLMAAKFSWLKTGASNILLALLQEYIRKTEEN